MIKESRRKATFAPRRYKKKKMALLTKNPRVSYPSVNVVRECRRKIVSLNSQNDALTIISYVLATADDFFLETSYMGMLGDLQLLRARTYSYGRS